MITIKPPHPATWPAAHAASWPATGRNIYLLDQNLLLASQYEPGGWLYENHSRASTATRTNSSGLIESVAIDVPRLQHDKDGNPLGYLHEPQATQHGPHWSDMTDGTWSVNNCATSSESGGPLGTYDKLTPAADSTNKVANPSASINFNSTGDWTISAIAVADGWDYAFLQENTAAAGRRSFFNLSTGKVHSEHAHHTARITPMKDGHYLIEITFNVGSTGTYFSGLGPSVNGASINGTGDGSSGVGFGGFQWEPGSIATSRIPTDGSSSVTRQADTAEIVVPADSDGFAYVTYGDGGETTFAVTPGGTWTIPTDLDDTYSRIIFKR